MIVNATYQCRRRQKQTFPMRLEKIKPVFKNFIVYDKKKESAAFSDKCKTCEYGFGGVNTVTGDTFTLCKITFVGVCEQSESFGCMICSGPLGKNDHPDNMGNVICDDCWNNL